MPFPIQFSQFNFRQVNRLLNFKATYFNSRNSRNFWIPFEESDSFHQNGVTFHTSHPHIRQFKSLFGHAIYHRFSFSGLKTLYICPKFDHCVMML